MSRTSRFGAATLACWVALAGVGVGYAQQREERREERRDERRAPETRRAKDVLGAKVSIRGDLAIGTVDDIIFSDDGYIDYLVVLNEGKYVLVPWEAAKFDFGKRAAAVDITQERFREVPTFTRGQWPQVYEPAYREKIYTYYGLKPGQERRIERRDSPRRP
jgi:PRC-barrel domain